jgi:hypothetical protein
MISLTFNDTKFQARFGGIISQAKNPRAILMNAGREVNTRLKQHFRMRDQTSANQLSDRRSHFWRAVARMVQNPEQENANTVRVTINHPAFAQKVFGGTIRAKAAEALTIPVEERAYGRTTATFEAETGLKLFLIRTGHGAFQNAVLAVKDDNARGFTVEYILTKSVTQSADTEALPDKTMLEQAILARAQRVLDRQLAQDNPDPEADIS